MKHINSKKYGFTLVELIVVIAIIGILSAIALPKLTTYVVKAEAAAAKANARTVYTTALSVNVLSMTDGDPNTNPVHLGNTENNYFTGNMLDMLNQQLDGKATVVSSTSQINGNEGKNNYVVNVFMQHGVRTPQYRIYFWNPENYHKGTTYVNGLPTYSFIVNSPGVDVLLF